MPAWIRNLEGNEIDANQLYLTGFIGCYRSIINGPPNIPLWSWFCNLFVGGQTEDDFQFVQFSFTTNGQIFFRVRQGQPSTWSPWMQI